MDRIKMLRAAGKFIISAFVLFSAGNTPKAFSQETEVVAPYYIFSDYWEHGIPSGFMGEKDGKGLKLIDTITTNVYKGKKCVMFKSDASESWRGIHIQFSGAWNVTLDEKTPLADLSKYDHLEFYARADVNPDGSYYLLTEIGVGGGGGSEEKANDTYLEIGPQWKKYSINLKGMDLSRVNTLLYMSMPVGTLYMDEIRFIKKKK